MGHDRRNPVEWASERQRRRELADQIVNTRRATCGNHAVWDAVADGRLTPVAPQFFFPTDLWSSLRWHEKRFVKVVAVGRSVRTTVLVGRSAGRFAGMWVVALTPEKVEIASTRGNIGPTLRRNPDYIVRRFRLSPRETYEHDGVKATRLARTAIDIARLHGFVEGLIAFDWLLHTGTDRAVILKEIQRMGHFHGKNTALRCLRHATALSESPFESLARALLIEAGLDPQPQHSVGAYRADLAIDGWLLIEIDGDAKYEEDTVETIKRENDRKKRIENQGYTILRFRPQELLANPLGFLSDVEAALHHQRQLGA